MKRTFCLLIAAAMMLSSASALAGGFLLIVTHGAGAWSLDNRRGA